VEKHIISIPPFSFFPSLSTPDCRISAAVSLSPSALVKKTQHARMRPSPPSLPFLFPPPVLMDVWGPSLFRRVTGFDKSASVVSFFSCRKRIDEESPLKVKEECDVIRV